MFAVSSLLLQSIWLLNADVSGMFLPIEPAREVQEESFSCQLSNLCLPFLFKPLNKLAVFLSFWEEPLRRIEDKRTEDWLSPCSAFWASSLTWLVLSPFFPKGSYLPPDRSVCADPPTATRGENPLHLTAATQMCVSTETQVLCYSPFGLELWFIVIHCPFSPSLQGRFISTSVSCKWWFMRSPGYLGKHIDLGELAFPVMGDLDDGTHIKLNPSTCQTLDFLRFSAPTWVSVSSAFGSITFLSPLLLPSRSPHSLISSQELWRLPW